MPLAKIVYASMTGNTEACADDDFCICVDMFEAQFEKTGATKGAELVRVDLSPEDEDEAHLEAFAETLAAHFN